MEAIFKKYYARLCHFAWQIVPDEAAVEDIVQDAFITYWKHHDTLFPDEKAHKNFLYSAVRFACLNYLRHDKVKDNFMTKLALDPTEDPQVIHKIIKSEIMNEIHAIVTLMPEKCQQVFRLGYLDGLSNAEISKSLDISVNTVKTQKRRGIALLKAKLHPEFFISLAGLLLLI